VKVGKFPFTANGKAFLQGEAEGVVKSTSELHGGKILGFHILGCHASDLLQEGPLAVARGATTAEIARLIHPHPALTAGTLGGGHVYQQVPAAPAQAGSKEVIKCFLAFPSGACSPCRRQEVMVI